MKQEIVADFRNRWIDGFAWGGSGNGAGGVFHFNDNRNDGYEEGEEGKV